jgi:hypothetical protein
MNAKKQILILIMAAGILFASVSKINAQQIELSPLVGYETGAYIHYSGGDLHIIGGMNYGGSMDVGMGHGRYVELSYTRMNGSLDNETNLNTVKLTDLNVDYYSIGVLQEMRPDEKATPYGLFTLGWVNYRPLEDYSNVNKMHVSLAGGLKINASEKIGIRLQARLLMPIYYAGGTVYVGTGGGGYGVSGGILGVQGDFTAQLVIKLRQ